MTYQDTYPNIPGWFGWAELYDQIVLEAPPEGFRIVEIGVWFGRSTIYLANRIKESGKDIAFYAVDNFKGSAEHQETVAELKAQGTTVYKEYINNLKLCEVQHYVTTLPKSSATASKQFEDGSLDVVFIDGSHEYAHVKQDIKLWLPKVKPGGLIAGDDYGSWPGVTKAVDELLPDAESKGCYWYYRVG